MTDLSSKSIAEKDATLIQITDAAFADAAIRSGSHLVCRPGCTQCCHGAFAIDALDAWRLQEGMQQLLMRDPQRAAAVQDRAHQYIETYTASFPGDAATGILGQSEEERAAFEEFANDAACPALDPESGLCDLYEARPMTCRVFGPPIRSVTGADEGLSICELCFTTATEEEILAAEMEVPHTQEEALLHSLSSTGRKPEDETIVAWCLIERAE